MGEAVDRFVATTGSPTMIRKFNKGWRRVLCIYYAVKIKYVCNVWCLLYVYIYIYIYMCVCAFKFLDKLQPAFCLLQGDECNIVDPDVTRTS